MKNLNLLTVFAWSCVGQRNYTRNQPKSEKNLLWGIRVVVCKFDLNVEQSSLVDAPFWAWHRSLPFEKVVVERSELDIAQVLLLEVGNLAMNAFQSSLSINVGLSAVAVILRGSRKKPTGAAYFRVVGVRVVVG